MMPQILVCRPHSGLQDLSKPIHPHANLPQQTPRVLAHTSPCSPMSEGAHWAHLVQMAVQPIVDDGMEVFQAATMEGVDQVPFSFGLIKFGVGRVEVFNFKQEVRGRDRCVRGTSQLLDLFKLENMKRVTILFRKLVKCAAKMGQAQWHTPVISAIQEAEAGGSQFEASLRNLVRPCLTIKTKKGWEMQLSGKVPLGLSFQYQKKKRIPSPPHHDYLSSSVKFLCVDNKPLCSILYAFLGSFTVSTSSHVDADCFLCVFLSHGEGNHIYAYDAKIKIQTLTGLFKGDK